jgi:hypothetical protein
MKRTFTLQVYLILSIIVGMILSFISVRAFPPAVVQPALSPSPASISTIAHTTAMPTSSTSLSETPAPYINIPGAWLLRVEFSRNTAPQVLKATYLKEGRITPFGKGDYRVELLNDAGDVLYSRAFEIDFVQGEPPKAIDKLTSIFILPAIDGAVRIRLQTPHGESIYDLPQ